MRKLGKNQQKIVDYVRDHSPVGITDLYSVFGKWICQNGGNLHGYTSYSEVKKNLSRLERLGLIRIKNRSRTDCKVEIT